MTEAGAALAEGLPNFEFGVALNGRLVQRLEGCGCRVRVRFTDGSETVVRSDTRLEVG